MILVDTNIFIDAFRKQENAVYSLSKMRSSGNAFISIITKMELIAGVRNKSEVNWLDEFLLQFPQVVPSSKDLHDALHILKLYQTSHGIGILDAIIAATALNNDWLLVTRNLKHFRFIPNLKLEVPYVL